MAEDSFNRLVGGLESAVAHAEGRPMSGMAVYDLGTIHEALIDARRQLAQRYREQLELAPPPLGLEPEAVLRMGANLKAVQDQIDAVERATDEELEEAKKAEAAARPKTNPATLATRANTTSPRRR